VIFVIEEKILELESDVKELKQDVSELKEIVMYLDEKISDLTVNEFSHIKSELRAIRTDLNTLFSWKHKLKSDLVTAVIIVAVLLLLKLVGV